MSTPRADSAIQPPAFWPRVPFLRMLVPLVAGIAVAYGTSYTPVAGWGWIVALLGLSLWLLASRPLSSGGSAQRLFLVLFIAFFSGLGYWRAVENWSPNAPQHLSRQAIPEEPVGVVVAIERIATTERNVRLTARLLDWSLPDPVHGRLLVYLSPTPAAARVRVGDHLRLRGRIRSIDAPANPYAFDAAAYYTGQDIFHRLSVRAEEDWEQLATGQRSLYVFAQSLRRRAERILQRYLQGDELAVATALILGKKDRLSLELRSAYADTGAMHVLAVSGLHVGIVGQFVFVLLGWLFGRRSWGRYPQLFFTLAAIWCFALMTGLAASVQRSALMFSLFYLGSSLFRRRGSGYNSLAFAAFLLLIYDPQQLFTVSFQLSFSAVAGILFFQQRLAHLLYFRYWVFNQAWALSCVGIAAQLGTLPLTLYYFHQFPLYFILSGIPVVLGATVGLGAGLALLLLAGIPLLNTWIGALLETTIGLQNAFLAGLQRLPGAVVRDIWVSLPQLPLLYLLVVLTGFLLVYRQVRYLRYLVWTLLLLGGWRAVERWQTHDQELFVVYDIYGDTVVDYVRGSRALNLTSVATDAVSLAYAADNWRNVRHYDPVQIAALAPSEDSEPRAATVRLGHRWLWILDRSSTSGSPPGERIDYLLVRNNVWPSRLPDGQLPDIEQLIVDGSNSPRTREVWREWALRRGIALYSTAEAGAFVRSE